MSTEWLTGEEYRALAGTGVAYTGARVLVDGRPAHTADDPYWGTSGPAAKYDDVEDSYAMNLASHEVLIHHTEVQRTKELMNHDNEH